MSHDLLWKVSEGDKIKLHKYDPAYTHPEIKKEDADTPAG